MKPSAPKAILPGVIVLALVAGMIALLAATRPEAAPRADAAPAESTATATARAQPSATRPPPTATPTSTPTPRPTATPRARADTTMRALNGMRLVDTAVVENRTGGEVVLPPGMPLETLAGLSSASEVSFFITGPAPFVPLSGKAPAGPNFDETGGSGVATGSGIFGDVPATFTLEFSMTPEAFQGTLRIATAASGETILILRWVGGGPEF
jgi:hypothetical protein